MKKTLVVIALAFGVSNAFAQTPLANPKGEVYLPETGDWAISMDVDPIFHWLGNAFNQNGGNDNPGTGFLNGDHTIIGKMFTSPTDAWRVLVRIGLTSITDKNNVRQDLVVTNFPNVAPVVTDKRKRSNTNIGLGIGKEMRRGKTRLQGIYGADAMLWFSSSKSTYTYGNTMSAITDAAHTSTPTTTDFNQSLGNGTYGTIDWTTIPPPDGRSIETKSGTTIGIGVRGFIGAEYFLWPKISIGAEYGWGIGFQTTGKGSTSVERTGTNVAGNPDVATQKTETAGASRFGFDTDMNAGTIFGFHGSNTGTASLRATFHF